MGTIETQLKTGKPHCRILKKPLFSVAGSIARHEETRIIEPAVNVRFDNLIYVAANTADQQDV